jgi:hypothetical protein
MSMNEYLAQYYGTGQASAETETLSKEASVDLFIKTAAEQGIPLENLSEEQIQTLFGNWSEEMNKIAEEDDGDDDKKDDAKDSKVEKAKEEHEEKKEAMAKMAEADFLGRVMAHAYVQELTKIAESDKKDDDKDDEDEEKKEGSAKNISVGRLSQGVKKPGRTLAGHAQSAADRAGNAVSSARDGAKKLTLKGMKDDAVSGVKRFGQLLAGGDKSHAANHTKAVARAQKADAFAGNSGHSGARRAEAGLMKSKAQKDAGTHASAAKEEASKVRKARLGAAGGAALAAGGGAAAYKSVEASAFSALDELAGELAIEKAAEAGFDDNEAASRIFSVLTLGLSEEDSVKVASAQDLDEAVDVRSLELLEAAGYPVNYEG